MIRLLHYEQCTLTTLHVHLVMCEMVNLGETSNGSWRIDFTDPVGGPSLTRDGFFNMSTRFHESYTLGLDPDNPEMSLVLHDPHFFMINTNPATVPHFSKQGGSH